MGILNGGIAAQAPPHNDFWFTQLSGKNSAGQVVNADTAMRLNAVYACVRIISETMGCVPLIMYERLVRGKQRAVKHPLYHVIHNQPNHWQTPMEFREMISAHAVLRGNGYAEIVSGKRGAVDQLIPLHPDRVTIKRLSSGMIQYTVLDNEKGTRELHQDQMFHLRGLSLDGLQGISPIEAERETFGGALALQEFSNRQLANDATPPLVLKHPGHFKDQESRENFGKAWQRAQTGENRGKTAVLEDGMSIQTMGMNNADLQFIEQMKFSLEQIARIFRVPLVLLQSGEKTQTFSSAEQFFLSFAKFTMIPWFTRFEQAMSEALIPEDNEFFVEFLVDALLRGDSKARAIFYKEAINDGWLTRNEVRGKENLNPLDGLDEPLQMLNMTPVRS